MAQTQVDQKYTSEQYNQGLREAEQLGFTGKNAANYAIKKATDNIQYETQLPEIIITPGVKRKYIIDDEIKNIHFAPHVEASKESDLSKIAAGSIGIPMAATALGIVAPMATEAGVGQSVSTVINNPWVQRAFAVDGIRNAVSNNGIQKTYRIGKDIYENGLTGRRVWDFTKSATGDILDIAGGAGTVKRGYNTGRKLLGFVDNIPYNHRNWYRSVGKDAIIDANSTGIIRGPESKSFPYFGRGKEGFTFRNYVIEGTPESANWEQAFAYERGKHIPQPKEPVMINGKPLDISYGTVGNDKYGDLFEAFPVTNGNANTTPTTNFKYWQKYPILGWKQKKFVQPKLLQITSKNAGKKVQLPKQTDYSFESRLVPGREQYKYRAERLGISPEEYINIKNKNKVFDQESYQKFLVDAGISQSGASSRVSRLFDPAHPERLTPHMRPIYLPNGKVDAVIYNSISSPYYSKFPANKVNDLQAIGDNHEFTHLRQFKHGDFQNDFMHRAAHEVGLDYNDIFHNGDRMDPETYNYLTSDGGTEIVARIGQLKDAIGLKKGEEFTRPMFNYLEQNYGRKMMDNFMSDMFSLIKDKDKFVKLMNSPSIKKYAGGLAAPVAVGTIAVSKEKSGGKLNYLNYVDGSI